jgi:hypothetical protein
MQLFQPSHSTLQKIILLVCNTEATTRLRCPRPEHTIPLPLILKPAIQPLVGLVSEVHVSAAQSICINSIFPMSAVRMQPLPSIMPTEPQSRLQFVSDQHLLSSNDYLGGRDFSQVSSLLERTSSAPQQVTVNGLQRVALQPRLAALDPYDDQSHRLHGPSSQSMPNQTNDAYFLARNLCTPTSK